MVAAAERAPPLGPPPIGRRSAPGFGTGLPQPSFRPIARVEDDGYAMSEYHLLNHICTHVDAPAHQIAAGDTLDEIPLDRLVTEAVTIDVSGRDHGPIPAELGGDGFDLLPRFERPLPLRPRRTTCTSLGLRLRDMSTSRSAVTACPHCGLATFTRGIFRSADHGCAVVSRTESIRERRRCQPLPSGRRASKLHETVPVFRSRRSPRRLLATILFTDIVGSTELAVRLGDESWQQLVATHHAAVRRELRRFRGRELDTAGDGFFAAFDQPAQAVRAAGAIVAAVSELGVSIRAGLHAGEAEAADGKIGGIAVHTASRVMSAAEPGEILVSGTLRDLVAGSGLDFRDRGVQELKGLPGEWHLWALVRATPDASQAGVVGSLGVADAGTRPRLPLPGKPSIAVLPFTNLSGDPEQDYFADGTVEDIITGLCRIKWIFVIARNSSFAYKGKAIDAK